MEHNNRPLISVQDLKVYFQGDFETARAVDGVSFEVRTKEMVCLVGESGCGKTVTALSLLGLISMPPGRIAGGKILFKGENLLDLSESDFQKIRGNHIAMVFQEPLTSLNPVFTIEDQIGEAIKIHKHIEGEPLRERCIQLLQDVGLSSAAERLNDYPHQLSGGQRQRVMIAMALACDPALIIADEPTTALDVTVQSQILQLFQSLQKKRAMSVLYITHDLGVVSNIAHRVYVMYAGVIVEEGKTGHIFSQAQHPYTRGLLASLPTRSKRGKRLYSIPGSVPDPAHKPPGCPFHPRCPHTIEACRSQFPELYDYGDGHLARCPVLFRGSQEAG